jgi:IS4 transposase
MTLSGCDIYCYYKARYQIEFLYRDVKQYTGLEHCQSKSETKLDFHFNTALTTINVAKAVYHLSQPRESRTPFSMADVKTQYSNEMMWNLIISKCGICPHSPKLKSAKKFVLNFGKRRA